MIKGFTRGTSQLFHLVALSAAVHFLVLRFVYPGFYTPFVPHHADHYIAAHLSVLGHSPLEVIGVVRPASYWMNQVSGMGGVALSLAVQTGFIFLNCAMLATILRRAVGAAYDARFVASFAAYLCLVVAHPQFYTMSLWDSPAIFSMFFLALGLLLYQTVEVRSLAAALILAFLAALLGFLAKETYGLAMLVMAFIAARTLRRGAALAAVFLVAFLSALAYNRYIGSVFVSGASGYEIDLSPFSILKIMLAYASAYSYGFIAAYVVGIGAAAAVAARAGERRLAATLIALPVAGILALLPMALLPGHFFVSYSWAAAYLIFSPIVLLWRVPWPAKLSQPAPIVLTVSLLAAALVSFSYKDGWWVLQQQERQGRLRTAIDYFVAYPGLETGKKKVLVVGITFAFSPFDYPLSIVRLMPNKEVTFDLLNDNTWATANQPPSRWIRRPELDLSIYDAVWVIRNNGSAAFAGNPKDPVDRAVIDRALAAPPPK